jgi:hypothetical protein
MPQLSPNQLKGLEAVYQLTKRGRGELTRADVAAELDRLGLLLDGAHYSPWDKPAEPFYDLDSVEGAVESLFRTSLIHWRNHEQPDEDRRFFTLTDAHYDPLAILRAGGYQMDIAAPGPRSRLSPLSG